MQSTPQTFFRNIVAILCCAFLLTPTVFATDGAPALILPSMSSGLGSMHSSISLSKGNPAITAWTDTGATYLVNTDNDSSLVGDAFKGYYYDTSFGFFKLDWDTLHPENNVRIIGSTTKCGDGKEWYQLAGYAYSKTAGFINFNYSSSEFSSVYYCAEDKALHGYAYHQNTGFQNFNGVLINMQAPSGGGSAPSLTEVLTTPTTGGTSGESFTNITGTITPSGNFVNESSMILTEAPDSITGTETIQGEDYATDWWKESTFYIVK